MGPSREAFLRSFSSRTILAAALCLALAPWSAAQSGAQLDSSETVFATLAALNACGYDVELGVSDPLRAQVRAEIAQNVARSPEAQRVQEQMCAFYRDHQLPDASRTLAQYVSLALYMTPPPKFALLARESDVPPDAAYVLGFIPHLQRFYDAAGLAAVWKQRQRDYDARINRYAEPIARMRFETDMYLKLASNTRPGRSFTVYLDPMAPPGQVNSRNYGADYFLVIAPNHKGELKLPEVRHTYLHFILDPMAQARTQSMKRLEPLLDAVQRAPVDESYKYDVSLLVTESLVQAIEARLVPGGKAAEEQRVAAMKRALQQGFILTQYFYENLARFEKEPTGLREAYIEWLRLISIDGEKKRARNIEFASEGAVEVVAKVDRARQPSILDLAENRLAGGEVAAAQKLARQALDERSDDPARAMFILARAATLTGDMQSARTYFERTLQVAREPRMIAWSHIYLARIFDLQEEREQALTHYRAALAAGDTTPDTRSAAERGLQQPYEPPARRPQ